MYYIILNLIGLVDVIFSGLFLFYWNKLGISGIGGGMAQVAISSIFYPILISSLVIFVFVVFSVFHTNRLQNPFRFWIAIAICVSLVFIYSNLISQAIGEISDDIKSLVSDRKH